MMDSGHDYVTPNELRIGLYVDLELGWMAHPFPKGSFKISTQRQIETLQSLGLKRVRYLPARSDPPVPAMPQSEPADADTRPSTLATGAPGAQPAPIDAIDPIVAQRQRDAALIAAQRASLEQCDRQFDAAIRRYRQVIERMPHEPLTAADLCRQQVDTMVGAILAQSESSIRLLSETTGDRAWMHPVNVTVLTLLLGKALGMQTDALRDLGVAAFLHDVGKTRLPDRARLVDASFTPDEYRLYQTHVAQGVALARQMELSADVQHTIGLHHEMMDGSGFPRQARGPEITQSGKVLALVNRYENMCNPLRPSAAITPHEALSMIFSQMKDKHDITVLAAFIRMMGVYPPGSVVQLADGRHALVVSVNSARPLKPRVIVHDPGVVKENALILDLEHAPNAGIRRSLRPDLLPRAAADYLAPRLRICYFFEQAADSVRGEVVA